MVIEMSEDGAVNSTLQQQMAAFEKSCRELNLKLTHQRLEIYRELAQATDHPSAETLHKRLKKTLPTLSLDTVYRTLATLEEYRLVKKIQTVDSQAYFETLMVQHHHLVCEKCKEITDFYWKSFDAFSVPEDVGQWGAMKNKSVIISGVCQKCQTGGEKK